MTVEQRTVSLVESQDYGTPAGHLNSADPECMPAPSSDLCRQSRVMTETKLVHTDPEEKEALGKSRFNDPNLGII